MGERGREGSKLSIRKTVLSEGPCNLGGGGGDFKFLGENPSPPINLSGELAVLPCIQWLPVRSISYGIGKITFYP